MFSKSTFFCLTPTFFFNINNYLLRSTIFYSRSTFFFHDQLSKIFDQQIGTEQGSSAEEDWELFRPKVKIADQTNDDGLGGWTAFFLELEELVSEYESFQHGSILMESLSIRLETAVTALHNILPYLSHTVQASISEIAHNMQLMFWDCQRCCEFRGRSRCSQVAVLSVSIPKTVAIGRPGRPKFNIREETLIELRSLGYSWEEIAQMLLVSRWTLQRRVSEFGLQCISRFIEISDDELDSKVREFVNEHGCFVGSSMVCGYLKSVESTRSSLRMPSKN